MRKMIAVAFAAAMLLGACSSGGDDEPTNTTGGGTSSATSGGATSGGGGDCQDLSSGGDFSMVMKDFEFEPSCLTVKNTQRLDLENDGNTAHTFTIDGTPVDVQLDAGDFQDLDAPGDGLPPGEYTFYCKFHGTPDGGGMAGTITVE